MYLGWHSSGDTIILVLCYFKIKIALEIQSPISMFHEPVDQLLCSNEMTWPGSTCSIDLGSALTICHCPTDRIRTWDGQWQKPDYSPWMTENDAGSTSSVNLVTNCHGDGDRYGTLVWNTIKSVWKSGPVLVFCLKCLRLRRDWSSTFPNC